MKAHIYYDLMSVLAKHLPTGDYLAAENAARPTEAEYGTRSDLRLKRDRLMGSMRMLAEEMEGLVCDVQNLNGVHEEIGQMLGRSDRYPQDDEQP